MAKIYNNADDFLREYFPKSYLSFKEEEMTSLEYYIKISSERFNQTVKEIIEGKPSAAHKSKSAHTPMT